ncbi:MAG: DUF4238 domain-containing protein [Sphingomicrobium sp.]
MSKPTKPPKKHHYVTQAQLRHFAHDKRRSQLHVFDKTNGATFGSSILNVGSENDFNTIVEGDEKLNFETMFDEVDGNGATVVNQITERRSLAWMRKETILKLADLGAVQLLRTRLSRETPGVLAREMRETLAQFGTDLDDPTLAPPTEADAKRGTIEAFLTRAGHRNSFLRLRPGLVEPVGEARFLISDHPVVFSNPFPYADHGLRSQGIMAHLPLSPTLLLTWHCPTIVDRFDHLLAIEGEDHPALRTYGKGLVTGEPIEVSDAEVERYNVLQFVQSRRFLFSHAPNFDRAREHLSTQPETGLRESMMRLGRMGEGPPPRPRMPEGWNLVVHGPHDHCLLHLEAVDKEGEGITAQTSDFELLNAAVADTRLDYVELYHGARQCRHLGHVKLEILADRGPGWFRAVHYDDAMRAFDRQISATRTKKQR